MSMLQFQDGRWFLQDPAGPLPLGQSIVDQLPDDEPALSTQEVKDLLDARFGPIGPMMLERSNRRFHRADTGRQGESRATCLPFAVNAAIEGRLARDNRIEKLSAECTNGVLMKAVGRPWCADKLPLHQAIRILHTEFTCREADCPYAKVCVAAPAVLPPRTFGLRECIALKRVALQSPDALVRFVDAGIDVVIDVLPHFGEPQDGVYHSSDPPADVLPGGAYPSHVVTVVGYGNWNGQRVFDCYDSLGQSVSDRGYVKLSAGFLRANGLYGYAVMDVVG